MAKFLAFTAENLFAAGEEVMVYFTACRFTRSKRGDGTFVDDFRAPLGPESIEAFGLVFDRGGMILPGILPEQALDVIQKDLPPLRYAALYDLYDRTVAEAAKHGLSVLQRRESLISLRDWGIGIRQGHETIGLVVIDADIPRIAQMRDEADRSQRIFKAMSDLQDGVVPTAHGRPGFYDSRLFAGDDYVDAGTWYYFPSGGLLKEWEYEEIKRRLPNLGTTAQSA